MYAVRQKQEPTLEQIKNAFSPQFSSSRDEFTRDMRALFVADLGPLTDLNLKELQPGERTAPLYRDGVWITAEIESVNKIHQDLIMHKIEERFKEYMVQTKAADRINLWYHNVANSLYIHIIHPEDRPNI